MFVFSNSVKSKVTGTHNFTIFRPFTIRLYLPGLGLCIRENERRCDKNDYCKDGIIPCTYEKMLELYNNGGGRRIV